VQSDSLAVYAAGVGENHSANFAVVVLPKGMVVQTPKPIVTPEPEPQPAAIPEAVQKYAPVGTTWVGSWGASAVTPANESGAYLFDERDGKADCALESRHAECAADQAFQCAGARSGFVRCSACGAVGGR